MWQNFAHPFKIWIVNGHFLGARGETSGVANGWGRGEEEGGGVGA